MANLPTAILAYDESAIDYSLEQFGQLARTAEAKGAQLFVVNEPANKPDIYWDSVITLSYLFNETTTIGLATTLSTNFNEPYHIARILSTNDHFSKGRVAWHVVRQSIFEKPEQFNTQLTAEDSDKRAREIFDITKQLWDSWEEDAVVVDRQRGVLFEGDKVHYINYVGEIFKVRGPNATPRSPQGQILKLATVKDGDFDLIAVHADIVFVKDVAAFDVKAFEQALIQENRLLQDVQLFTHANEIEQAAFPVGGQFFYAHELSKLKHESPVLKSRLKQKQLVTP